MRKMMMIAETFSVKINHYVFDVLDELHITILLSLLVGFLTLRLVLDLLIYFIQVLFGEVLALTLFFQLFARTHSTLSLLPYYRVLKFH